MPLVRRFAIYVGGRFIREVRVLDEHPDKRIRSRYSCLPSSAIARETDTFVVCWLAFFPRAVVRSLSLGVGNLNGRFITCN